MEEQKENEYTNKQSSISLNDSCNVAENTTRDKEQISA